MRLLKLRAYLKAAHFGPTMLITAISFVPGGDQGGFITNPSLKALISGATTVKLVNSDDPTKVYQLEIIVNP